ncbi:MAG: hypothetical protein Q8O81_09175, partial [Giesbergeria sp.]|nr:hypothetical protein [Giesbergeria sp.]
CTHRSQALGGRPRSQEIRSLAWVVHRWAGKTRPDVITLENVESRVRHFDHIFRLMQFARVI